MPLVPNMAVQSLPQLSRNKAANPRHYPLNEATLMPPQRDLNPFHPKTTPKRNPFDQGPAPPEVPT